jgi:hypothetical protein
MILNCKQLFSLSLTPLSDSNSLLIPWPFGLTCAQFHDKIYHTLSFSGTGVDIDLKRSAEFREMAERLSKGDN